MNSRIAALVAALLLAFLAPTAPAAAATLSYSSDTISLRNTNWSGVVGLQQFDPTLGSLQSVSIELVADLAGSAKVESLNNTAATLTLQLGATLTLTRPDGSALLVTAPLIASTFAATAYDGTLDYGGGSGVTASGLALTASQSASFSDAADLALFSGSGSVQAPLAAVANSRTTGPGNLFSSFRTQAGGQAIVTYSYLSAQTKLGSIAPAVPEPSTWALLLAGLAVVWRLSRRRH